jgi:hypothetical protein
LIASHAESPYASVNAGNGTLGGPASLDNGGVLFTNIYTPPNSIASNCSTDVSASLNTWIASVPNNSAIVFPANSCYGLTSSLTLTGRSGLTINGNGGEVKLLTTLANSSGSLSIWDVNGGSNITIENSTLIGDNPDTGGVPSTGQCSPSGTLEWQYGIAFEGTNTGTVKNDTIEDVCGDFVEAEPLDTTIQNPQFGDDATNITITGGGFYTAGRQGVGITDGNNVTVSGVTIENVSQDAIDVEADTAQELDSNITITNNTFSYIAGALLANFGAGGSPNVGTITFSGNTQTHPLNCIASVYGGTPSGSTARTNYVITNNNLEPYETLADLSSMNNVTITGNTDSGAAGNGGCSNNGVYSGVNLDDVNTATVSNNNFGSTVNTIDQVTGGSDITVCSNQDSQTTTFNLPTVCN